MNRMYFGILMASLLILSFGLILGCGSNPTGGGGGGGTAFDATMFVATTGSNTTGAGTRTSPYQTIQHAMDVCHSNEVIGVFNGTYNIDHAIVWTASEDVTLRGESRDRAIISAEAVRCIIIDTTTPSNQVITIESLTLTRGVGPSGISRGMGISLQLPSSTLHVSNVKFDKNGLGSAANSNGALGIASGLNSLAIIDNCIFSNNMGKNGAAIYADAGSRVYAYRCSIFSNSLEVAGNNGGAIYFDDGILTLEACDIHDNTASTAGGAMYLLGQGTISNCIIYNNKSQADDGGGIKTGTSATYEIVNCTIVSNEAASGSGGGIEGYGGSTIRNCIVWGNIAGADPDVTTNATNSIEVVYSDLSNFPANYVDGRGTIEVDPLFVKTSSPYASASDLILRKVGGNADVRQGGTSEAGAIYDYNGVVRTAPWSMGAYQQN